MALLSVHVAHAAPKQLEHIQLSLSAEAKCRHPLTTCAVLSHRCNRFSRSGTYYAPDAFADDSVDTMTAMVTYIRGLPYNEGPEVCFEYQRDCIWM